MSGEIIIPVSSIKGRPPVVSDFVCVCVCVFWGRGGLFIIVRKVRKPTVKVRVGRNYRRAKQSSHLAGVAAEGGSQGLNRLRCNTFHWQETHCTVYVKLNLILSVNV